MIFLDQGLSRHIVAYDEDWDKYSDGALFALNTNKSTTTKCSPFFLMCCRHPRLPLEVEKFIEHFDEDQGNFETLIRDLTTEDVLQEYIEKMSATRDALFPKVEQKLKLLRESKNSNTSEGKEASIVVLRMVILSFTAICCRRRKRGLKWRTSGMGRTP